MPRLLLSLLLLSAFGLSPSLHAQVPEGRVWANTRIVNLSSGLCLGTQPGWNDGANVVEESCQDEETRWQIVEIGPREYAFVNVVTGLVLDVSRSSREDGANVQLWRWNRSNAQRWRLESGGRNDWQIINIGSGKCLETESRSRIPGANVWQWSCRGEAVQRWQFADLGSAAAFPPATGWPSPAPSFDRPRGQLVYTGSITSQHSGRCVEVSRSARDAGNIQQGRCSADPNQVWEFIDLGRGDLAIVSRGTGRVMDAFGDWTGHANVAQRAWNDSPSQRWRLQSLPNGLVRIVHAQSGACLDLEGADRSEGANIILWGCHMGANQQWRLGQNLGSNWLVPLGIRPPLISEGRPRGRVIASGALTSHATGRCIDIPRSTTADGAGMRQWGCNGSAAQSWEVIEVGRGEFALLGRASGKVMEVLGDQRSGSHVAQYGWNGSPQQRWRIEPSRAGAGLLQIVNVASQRCLDLAGGRNEDGTPILVWDCHGGSNQLWRISGFDPGVAGLPFAPQRPDPNPIVSENIRAEAPPMWAVGVFTGSANEFGGDIELVLQPNGQGYIQSRALGRQEVSFRGGRLLLGFNAYALEETGNGMRLLPPSDRALPIQLRRMR